MDMKSLIAKMDELSTDKDKTLSVHPDVDLNIIDESTVAERKDPDKFRNLKAEYEKLSGKKAPAGTSTQSMQISVDKLKREKDSKKVDEAKKGLPPWLKKDDKKDEKSEKDDKPKDNKAEKVEESIMIQADGEEAASLLNLLKLSGQQPMGPMDATPPIGQVIEIPPSAPEEQDSQEFTVDEADRDPSYSNTPDEETYSMDAAIPSGDDLNRSKTMTKHGYQQGDNPLAMEDIENMEGKLSKMFESLSKEQINEYGDTKKGQKMLTKVQKRATDRSVKAADKGDAKTAKKNQEVANNAWDRFDKVDESKKKSKVEKDDDADTDEWYDKKGRPSPNGAYDAGGHYYLERDKDPEVTFTKGSRK